jgi:uncharacterized protein (DUF427 family)
MATTREIKIPGPDHPMAIEPHTGPVSVTVEGIRIAESTNALILREASYQPVYYIPISDIDMRLLQESDSTSYCSYKGDCNYFSVVTPTTTITDAAWIYHHPYPAAAAIAEHIAFYANRVTISS